MILTKRKAAAGEKQRPRRSPLRSGLVFNQLYNRNGQSYAKEQWKKTPIMG